MTGINKVILIGNLGADPEVKDIGNKQVANFNLATTKSYKNAKGERVEKTEWHRCVIWGKPAGVMKQYVKKGSKIYVEGENQTRSYEKDENTFYVTEVVCDEMNMLDGKKDQ